MKRGNHSSFSQRKLLYQIPSENRLEEIPKTPRSFDRERWAHGRSSDPKRGILEIIGFYEPFPKATLGRARKELLWPQDIFLPSCRSNPIKIREVDAASAFDIGHVCKGVNLEVDSNQIYSSLMNRCM